ncbi:hypothetical protein [Pontibacter beigongshangensis]|uniref:hypothetical protein n=1 Tax=Pontibacter beigongshangensis TaxID=2574733 RepID=UPI0016503CAB|nr:hypothetical protein [Pontibacter beigongshangensis]
MSLKDLQPGQQVDTPGGVAEFIRYKQNKNKQNYQVKLNISGKVMWYTEIHLRDAKKAVVRDD